MSTFTFTASGLWTRSYMSKSDFTQFSIVTLVLEQNKNLKETKKNAKPII